MTRALLYEQLDDRFGDGQPKPKARGSSPAAGFGDLFERLKDPLQVRFVDSHACI